MIGSGIAAQRLSTDTGIRLLENAAATAAGLFAIILMFGPVSGAHFNPVVSLVDAAFGGLSWRDAAAYVPAQVAGCASGAVLANAMFAEAAVSISETHRASGGAPARRGRRHRRALLVIFSLARSDRTATAPAAVGAYIGAAYWFTSSTSFANPAISVGRMFSDTFAGIAPASVPGFVVAQLAGGALAIVLIRTLYPDVGADRDAADVVIPHPDPLTMATALFVCLHNAGRSQMSAALFERAAAGRHHALSAGTTPGDRVHPEVVEVMRELGIDLADRTPQLLTRDLAEQADVVVTMGCGDACPYIPGKRYLDWDLTDPKGLPIDEVREIRDDIARRVEALVAELDAA